MAAEVGVASERLREIIFHHEWYPLRKPWRDAVKRWLSQGYWCEHASVGHLLITGEGGQSIRVVQYAFGTKFLAPDGSEVANYEFATGDERVIAALGEMLLPLTDQTREANLKRVAPRSHGEFHWLDGTRSLAVRLVAGKIRVRGVPFEEAVVDTLTNSLSVVCGRYKDITLRILTGFVSDCWDEIQRQHGRNRSLDGEIERIYAALTGQYAASSEIPEVKAIQMDLFSWADQAS